MLCPAARGIGGYSNSDGVCPTGMPAFSAFEILEVTISLILSNHSAQKHLFGQAHLQILTRH